MKWTLGLTGVACASLLLSSVSTWAGPKIVAGPGANPGCFKPWSDQTKFFQWDKKPGPYKIALVNGFVGNTWRIQMVKTAKAFAEQAGIKENIKEFKVVSTGTDVAAQLGAMEDFINQGFDAIITIAVAPDGFDRIIRLADKNNVVVVPFDNILDTDKVMMVNEDQKEMGRMSAKWLIDESGKKAGDILEVRGLPGNSVDRDRHIGFREIMEAAGNKFNITEVVGNWDTGTSQKVTADALAVHGHFDGVFTQGGSDGTVQAMIARGMTTLTGDKDPRDSWARFFNAQDFVGISVGGQHVEIAHLRANWHILAVDLDRLGARQHCGAAGSARLKASE